MKKTKHMFLIVGICAFLIIFLLAKKAYGSMADIAGITDTAIKNSESGDEKMKETVTDSDTAIKSSGSDEEKAEYADKKMSEVLSGGEYSKMSLTERKELASGILSQLEQDGYITGLSYNEDSYMYSFEYIDGTLGGWSIKDFSAQKGRLPMN